MGPSGTRRPLQHYMIPRGLMEALDEPHYVLWPQDTMLFVAQAHVAGALIFERWSANGYTLHLTACASARI